MKKLLTAVLMGVLVETLTIATELPSLPIGSTNALIEPSVRLVNEVATGLNKQISETEWERRFGRSVPYSPDKDGPLAGFISAKLKETVARAIDPNDMSLAGARFESWYASISRYPVTHDFEALLADRNKFTVEEYGGKLAVPEEAYKVDLAAAVTRSIDIAILVPGAERATLVARARDQSGRVIKELDSAKPPPNGPRVLVRGNFVWLPRDYIVNGTPGEVTIWYKNGGSQVFDLATGKLLSPITTRLGIERASDGALKLTVIASAGTSYVLEYGSDASFAKTEAVGSLASEQMGVNGSREYLITPTGEMKFFRARLVQPK